MFNIGFPPGWSTMRKLLWIKCVLLSAAASVIRTVTGSAPLALTNAVSHAIHSLTQYGKCVQDGTPTPDAPVDIVCNNGRVVAGNCISNIPDGQGTFVTPSEATTTRIYKAFPTDLIVGRQYTVTVAGADWSIIVQKKRPDDTDKTNVSGWVTTYDFTPEDGYVYGIAMRKSDTAITPADFNGTLTLDTTDGKPWAAGTPETLTVLAAGETNLFNASQVSMSRSKYDIELVPDTYNPTGFIATARSGTTDTSGITLKCPAVWFTENTTYSITGICDASFAVGNGTSGDSITYYRAASTDAIFTITDIAEGQLTINIRIYFGVQAEGTKFNCPNIVITECATQTVNDVPMLLGVGDYKDEAEIINGPVGRKVLCLVLDGVTAGRKLSESWNATYKRGNLSVSGMLQSASSVADAMCTRFDYSASVYGAPTKDGFCTNSGVVFFTFIEDADVNSAADGNAKFAAWYAEGKPAMLFVPLSEETTEQGTAHALLTAEGTNTVDVASNVDPVTLTCEYAGLPDDNGGGIDPGTSEEELPQDDDE